nr:DUF4263 domain-containing protein [Candidatus Woesearchaeota archaeon]
MDKILTCNERTFIESEFYELINRYPVLLSSNSVWLYSVDECYERDRTSGKLTDKRVIRVTKWRAINDKKNKKIKYWRIFRSYNIRSMEEWSLTSEIVNAIIGDGLSNPNFVVLPKEKYKNFLRKKDEISELNAKFKKIKDLESSNIVQLNIFKRRFNIMKSNVKDYENKLKKFKTLIDSSKSTETDVHNYFIANKDIFWIFGLEYIGIEHKVWFPPGKKDYQFDIMLQRYDNFYDLVELKGPNENLFDRRTEKRSKPNQKFSEAIGQVFTYLHICDTKNIKNIFKPKSLIVIGKQKTDKIQDRRIFSSHLSNVEIITYTELYNRGKKLIDYIKTTTLS